MPGVFLESQGFYRLSSNLGFVTMVHFAHRPQKLGNAKIAKEVCLVATDEVTKSMGGDFIGDTFNTDPKSSGAPRAQQGSSLGSHRAFSSLAYLALLAFIFWWRTMRKPHKVSAYGAKP